MTKELELPPARASRAHRAEVLNETYSAAVLNGVPAVAGPVDGDAWASVENRSEWPMREGTDLDLLTPTSCGVWTSNEAFDSALPMEPPC